MKISNKIGKDNSTHSTTIKKRKVNTLPKLHMDSQMIKGGLVFLVEEVNRLNVLELKKGLKQVFGYSIQDDLLLDYLEHLRDRNVLSIDMSNGKLNYKIRKVAQAEMELSQVRNIVATLPIMKQKFEIWKRKIHV